MQIDFDPSKISYAKLLEIFWASHNPCGQSGSRQYMTAVFVHNDAQRKQAEATRDREAARLRQKILTSILPVTEFTVAEDYHQKYFLRNHGLMKEFRALYPKDKEFLASTAAARVNGYLGGCGTVADLEREIQSYGLTAASQRVLLQMAKQRWR